MKILNASRYKNFGWNKVKLRASLELLRFPKYGVERQTDKHLKQAQEELYFYKNDWRLVDDNGTGNDDRRRKFPRGLNWEEGARENKRRVREIKWNAKYEEKDRQSEL